jgi:hypothetical protein
MESSVLWLKVNKLLEKGLFGTAWVLAHYLPSIISVGNKLIKIVPSHRLLFEIFSPSLRTIEEKED